ncbi:glycosyltransferase family 2 protein [Riemerella anatipestifer]|nr:glycosyltransferase family 2 protein [Riemerella anatipestifer]
MDKVVTIIVTYNGMRWLDKCLSSIRNSKYPTDVIVIDNGSTDETISFIKTHFPEVYLIESKENLGFGKANNLGISLGLKQDADFFLLLNQDAYLFPETIGNLIDNFKKYPEYGLISPIQLSKELEVETIFKSYLSKYPDLIKKYVPTVEYQNRVLPTDFTNAALWMLSKRCITKIGGFSPLFYHYGEDVDYVNRVGYHGFKNGVSCNSFGIHDREVKPRLKVSEYNKKKKHPGPWPLRYYITLVNPNYSIFKAISNSLYLFGYSLLKHLLKGNFFSVKYDFIVIKEVLFKLRNVLKIRKIVKNNNSPFL